MKKRFIYSFCALMAASAILPSCNKEFLDTAPTDQVAPGLLFTTTKNAMSAMNGIYRAMYSQYSNQDEGGEGSVMIDMDMMGEDLVNTNAGNGWFNSVYRWITHRTVNAGQVDFVYRYHYRLIANANKILDQIDAATGSEAEKRVIKGEALAMRAYAHFKLVQIFAKRWNGDQNTANPQLGVPLLITPDVAALPRSTVSQVYAQINTDLDAAIGFLTGATARSTKSHINLNVAQGIKARVALTQGNYAVASQMAVAARTGYPLMSNADYLAGFNNLANQEWIWGINHIADQTTFFYSFFAYMSVNFNSTNIRSNPKAINSALYNQISATDVRKQLWDPTAANTSYPVPPSGSRYPYMNRKFLANSASNSWGDMPFMRSSEMYLIEAEAQARLGNTAAARTALFTVAKQRDASYVTSVNSGDALINEILTQRRVELWGEGFRFLDLKRLNLPLNRNGANHDGTLAGIFEVPAGDVRWEWLIPQAEINNNTLVEQNP
ncbi:RagB/SusD family nutrient uptake outer membrane protein [Mucilaginibacter aquatilis]|uniref:RagB/SusD family nutrient uptake outer membrane protein n=1 Tax=Mucilaginibacter aquatilis TaxID=1517760 RepID=A0A6I4IR91_9SPHI|nr:RagB/SusD family nutrient uptake outer membrane protein [Mucilaginibacter aquatilis]MVN93083.1 RagB/SusD family nutrient uptake outer membrane protein [Mucilaginibacter aquatilis]